MFEVLWEDDLLTIITKKKKKQRIPYSYIVDVFRIYL